MDLTVLATAEPPSKAPQNSKRLTRITVCLGVRVRDPITEAATVLPSWKPFEYAKRDERKITKISMYADSLLTFAIPDRSDEKLPQSADLDDHMLQLGANMIDVFGSHDKTSVDLNRAHDALQIVYGK